MAKSDKTIAVVLTTFIFTALMTVAGSVIWLGLHDNKSILPTNSASNNSAAGNSTASNPQANVQPSVAYSSLEEVPLTSDRQVNYSQLKAYLRQKDWKAADLETYLRLLDAAGSRAQVAGMIPREEVNQLSCTDLKTVDQLWNTATNGQQGFSVQMQILRALGSDYHRLYDKVGWQELPPSNKWRFEVDYNPQTKRMQFKPGKEPNYANPPAGHLPTTEIGYNLDVAFSGALKRCNF